jgi:hypothetical protein
MRAVLRAAKQRKALSGGTRGGQGRVQDERHRREQHLITVMLIVVVAVFLVCMLPQAIQHLLMANLGENISQSAVHRLTISANIANLLVMINSSVNFLLYSYLSIKFRRTFRSMFCRCLWTDVVLRLAASGRDGATATVMTSYCNTGDRKASSQSLLVTVGYVRVRSPSAVSSNGGGCVGVVGGVACNDRQLQEISRRRNYFPMHNFTALSCQPSSCNDETAVAV